MKISVSTSAIVFGCLLSSCASMFRTAGTATNEQATVTVYKMERVQSYNDGLRIHSAKDPSKDSLLIMDVQLSNAGASQLLFEPYGTQLTPVEGTYGIMPVAVSFSSLLEDFASIFTAATPHEGVKLRKGESARRRLVFVYPKDRPPAGIRIRQKGDSKDVQTVIEASLSP